MAKVRNETRQVWVLELDIDDCRAVKHALEKYLEYLAPDGSIPDGSTTERLLREVALLGRRLEAK